MRKRAVALAVFALIASARAVSAQDLGQVVERLASYWARGDAVQVARFAASSGVSIDVDGEPIGPLGIRQVAAALRRLFEDGETVAMHATVAQIVGGKPERAFSELTWFVRARGTTIPEHATVFMAFIRENEGWRVTQIRLLR